MKGVSLKRTSLACLCIVLSVSSWIRPQSQVQVGYTIMAAAPGTVLPVGTTLFTYTNSDGVMVSQAGVGAVEPIATGRIFVDERGTRTGIALVNTSNQTANIALTLRSASGQLQARKPLTLEAAHHLATFVFQQFENLPADFIGSLTFESDQKVAAITLRQNLNSRGEPLYTTLPVVDLAAPASSDPMVFPQIAAGDGYVTQLVLINSSGVRISGKAAFGDKDGVPLSLRLGGVLSDEFSYQIEPDGAYRAELDRPSGLGVGYAVVTPDPGSNRPSGSAIFQFKVDNNVVTEAGVGASRTTTAARIFVDNVGSYTGVAIASTQDKPVEVLFSLIERGGSLINSARRTLSTRGHLAIFAHELFPDLAATFTGVMEISCPDAVASVTLKLTINQRNEQILTTLPVADMTRPPSASLVVFPQIAIGGGFSTRLILINSTATSIVTGRLSFNQSPDGAPMAIPLAGQRGTAFNYYLAGGGGRQFFPGNPAGAAQIQLLDPATNQITSEIIVNEGNSIQTPYLVFDTSGAPRDDFDISCLNSNPDVASVNPNGVIQAKKAGFSTLILSSGDAVTTGTITVVKVDAGVAGFEIQGVTQDLARRLYLAAAQQHTILLAQDLKQTPDVYAGKPQQPGLKNDVRKESLFRNPAYIAYNQAEGSLYVADAENHVIRRVQPGPAGRVETLAGTGTIGSSDGSLKAAAFFSPRGIALDNRGNLWIADSGNHTIRRVKLGAGTVETIAGKVGVAGSADGVKDQARFNTPIGVAIELETTAQALDRELKGLPPPPISLLVADSGNGLVRRVKETGAVETIRSGQSSPSTTPVRSGRYSAAAGAPMAFRSPMGIAEDSLGNIYVSEADTGRVRVVLPNSAAIALAQEGTFSKPRGLVISQTGRVVVADNKSFAQEIAFGTPEIASVTPTRVSNKGGDSVTLRGKNFAPDTVIILAGAVVAAQIKDTQTVSFTVPPLPSGQTTLTLQNRGGLAQVPLLVDPVPLSSLTAGYITTVAGGTTFIGDGGPATLASIASPCGLAADPAGSLFIADFVNNRIRKVNAQSGAIFTVAGNGEPGDSGDNGPATAASFSNPCGVALGSSGELIIADTFNHRIRSVDAATGTIRTIAGTGNRGHSGDGGPAAQALLAEPTGVAVDPSGRIVFADRANNRIRRIDPSNGAITTLAGNGAPGFSGDDGPAIAAQLSSPEAVAIDAAGNIYVADRENHRIRKVDAASGIIRTYAGNGQGGFSGDSGAARSAQLNLPVGVAVDANGDLYIADKRNNRIRKVGAAGGTITTAVGSGPTGVDNGGFGGDGGPAASARLWSPNGVFLDAAGNIFISDLLNHRVRKVNSTSGTIATIAGSGEYVTAGDNGPATAARLLFPFSVAMDRRGNMFIADTYNLRVRKVDAATGVVTTVAGNGGAGFSGDGGPATSATLFYPAGIAVDDAGNLIITDTLNHRVRRVAAATGNITTVAGNGIQGFSGDYGPATAAQLSEPQKAAVDRSGNIYIADTGNHRIRKVAAATGIITTMAGNGLEGFSGDNGLALFASLDLPSGIAVDDYGSIAIADTYNHRIRVVLVSSGIIVTVAGTGTKGYSGDNGQSTRAQLAYPFDVALDSAANIYIADSINSRIRRVDINTLIITTVAGTGWPTFSGDSGPGAVAGLASPFGVGLDSAGNVYIADTFNSRIRGVRGPIR